MPAVSVRKLLRDASAVFGGLERDGEPVLITRRGRPVAALIPVDPEDAEAMILSAAPEMIESRRQAENARVEGRTTPLAAVRRRLDAIDAEQAAQVDDVESAKAGGVGRRTTHAARGQTADAAPDSPDQIDLLADLTNLFGARQAAKVNQIANQCAYQITSQSLAEAAEAGLIEQEELQEQLAERIRKLNASLLAVRLRQEILSDLQERVDAVRAGTESLEGILRKSLTDTALGEASMYVSQVNADVITSSTQDRKLSPESMEAKLSVILSALER